eukprot:gnl/MRDRNA2_/MRDRNA2_90646_c0_seq1.p1 gnl/MRDRNA2_/MRDRNA2_90646_c0~~gnl/MRDRNA2_/MRDRNA2_90646_c0_seq1.p1  ORF type:complete len:359 (+),score=76.16 gnl/MRDRNA2_/MRDRNA2_90646_c0_seq1:76-1077(+)
MATTDSMKMEYPVKNTFIEYPCRRSISLEMFVKERETQSEPIDLMSRLESLDSDFPKLDSTEKDSDPAKIEYLIKNTFIDGLADHPATRSFSLEEFLMERRCKSAPNTAPNSGIMQRLESLEEEPCSVPDHFPATPDLCRGGALELEPLDEEDPAVDDCCAMVPQEGPMIQLPSPLQFPMMPGAAFQGIIQYQDEAAPMPACSGNVFSDRSTMAPSECDFSPHDVVPHLTEQIDTACYLEQQDEYDDSEVPGERAVVIELESVLGKWSVGSTGHHFGRCKPCAFFWKSGCQAGQACQFCHTCPPDEKKKRTKNKLAWRKAMKAARTSLRYGLF